MCHFLHVKLMVHVSCPLTKCLGWCVWSFRRVCAVGVYLFKLLPMTRRSLFWSPECRIMSRSRAATSKLQNRIPHLYLGRRTPYRVNKTHVKRVSLIFLYGYQSRSDGGLATLTCRPNNLKYLVNNMHHCLFVLLSSVEHLLWNEQPGVRVFRLFAPGGLTHSQPLHQIFT